MPSNVYRVALVLSLLSGAALSHAARAQEAEAAEPARDASPVLPAQESAASIDSPRGPIHTERSRGWEFEVFGDQWFDLRADMDDDDESEVSVARTTAGGTITGPIGSSFVFGLGVSSEWSFYDFDADAGALGGAGEDLLDDTYAARIAPVGTFILDDRWSITLGGFANFSGERDADFGDSAYGGGFVAVGYRFSDAFSLSAGAGATSRLEDDAVLIPVLTFTWDINDRVRLSTTGLGARLGVEVTDTLTFFLRGGYEYRQYRLDDDHPTAPEGVMRDGRVPIGAGFDWRPTDWLTLGLEGGATVYQEYDLIDDDGDDVDEFETDPSAYVGFSLSIVF